MNSYEIKIHERNRTNRPQRRRLLLRSVRLIALALAMTATRLALAGGFSNAGKMNLARYGQAAMLLANGKVLELGGANSLAAEQSADLYDPATGKWTLIKNLDPAGLFGYGALLLPKGEVLVVGGSVLGSGGNFTNGAALFNPSTGTWTPTGSMSIGRDSFMLILLPNGKVLVAGGDVGPGSGQVSSAELYDPVTGTWTPTGAMTGAYTGWGAALLGDGKVLAIVDTGADLYDPATGSWTATTPPPIGGGFACLLLPDGLSWGDGELYDPASAQWTTFAKPTTAGGFAVLATGQVLAAGGTFEVNARPYPIEETTKSAELWDPSTLAWTSIANLNVSRTGQSMTLLLNGQVLLAGGESFDKSAGALVPIASAELYTP